MKNQVPLSPKIAHQPTLKENIRQSILCINLLRFIKGIIKTPVSTSLCVSITGFNLQQTLPKNIVLNDVSKIIIDNATTNDCFSDSDYTKLFGFLVGNAEVLVIINTRASISITPVVSDFLGDL